MPDEKTFELFMKMVEKAFEDNGKRIDALTSACHELGAKVDGIDRARETLAIVAAADHALLTQHLLEAASKTNGNGKKSFSLFKSIFGG